MSDISCLFPLAPKVGGSSLPFAGDDPFKFGSGRFVSFFNLQLEGTPSRDVIFFGPISPEQVEAQVVFAIAAHDVIAGTGEHQGVGAVGLVCGEDGIASPQVFTELPTEVSRGKDIRLR